MEKSKWKELKPGGLIDDGFSSSVIMITSFLKYFSREFQPNKVI